MSIVRSFSNVFPVYNGDVPLSSQASMQHWNNLTNILFFCALHSFTITPFGSHGTSGFISLSLEINLLQIPTKMLVPQISIKRFYNLDFVPINYRDCCNAPYAHRLSLSSTIPRFIPGNVIISHPSFSKLCFFTTVHKVSEVNLVIDSKMFSFTWNIYPLFTIIPWTWHPSILHCPSCCVSICYHSHAPKCWGCAVWYYFLRLCCTSFVNRKVEVLRSPPKQIFFTFRSPKMVDRWLWHF